MTITIAKAVNHASHTLIAEHGWKNFMKWINNNGWIMFKNSYRKKWLVNSYIYLYLLLTIGTKSKPCSINFHSIVRSVARIKLGFWGHRFCSSNQFASNLSVNSVDSR